MSNIANVFSLIPDDGVAAAREVIHDQQVVRTAGAPFGVRRGVVFSSYSLPCTPPPWGIIAAIDLGTGDVVWRRTLGTTKDMFLGIPLEVSTPTLGGSIFTSGYIIFIASTMNYYLRALSTESGNELWIGDCQRRETQRR